MRSDHAELSSVSSTLEELTGRVTAAAGRANDARDEVLAADLYEVERAMAAAARRLRATVERLAAG
jgi:hypothetical protein